jgi:hypothetical protein
MAEINAVEKEHEALADAALRARSEEFKERLSEGKLLDATAVRTHRSEPDRHSLATGVRARLKSGSLAVRPPAKGSLG